MTVKLYIVLPQFTGNQHILRSVMYTTEDKCCLLLPSTRVIISTAHVFDSWKQNNLIVCSFIALF